MLPIAFVLFCVTFAFVVTAASGDGEEEAGAVPGHTVARMDERVFSIKENIA